jgi:DNA-binding response OmpR family regulator
MPFSVTGQSSDHHKARTFEAGANQFYTKPLRLKVLDEAIVRIRKA